MYGRNRSAYDDLARAEQRKRDAALLRATTELFVLDVSHDRDEIRRFEELAGHLIPRVSTVDRAFVAERLAICADAPKTIVTTLARDVIDVAAPLLRRSPALKPIDQLAIIAATGTEHHRLIARREHLSPEVERALRLGGDGQVLAYLDQGPAREAQPIPVPQDLAAHFKIEPLEERPIDRLDPWHFLGLDRAGRLAVIAQMASGQFASDGGTANIRVDRAFRSILSAARIVGFARSGQLSAIVTAAAEGLDLQRDLVAAAVNDRTGELLAVILKALRLDDIQARQVFLLASPTGRDIQTFFPLSDLFSGMEPSVAESIISAWRDRSSQRAPTHQPHLAPNSDRRRATQTYQQRDIRPDEQAKRA